MFLFDQRIYHASFTVHFPQIWQVIYIIPFILFFSFPLTFLKIEKRAGISSVQLHNRGRRYQHHIWLAVLITLCKAPVGSEKCTSLTSDYWGLVTNAPTYPY